MSQGPPGGGAPPASEGLTRVGTASLERLRSALSTGHLTGALTRADLVALGVKEQLDTLVAGLQGHTRAACESILDTALAERRKHDRPPPELVWTGPESPTSGARDTAVVLRELFESAQERVLLAGYSFRDAESVLRPLATAMETRGVVAALFVDIRQAELVPPDPAAYAQAALNAFITESWPFGPPYPHLYTDKRCARPGPPWCSLHAKCVAVDGKRALVSSANFTLRGQDRNIETGVLLHDVAFASQLERQWRSLIDEGLVYAWHP
jgi:phosphatidylserine/phosphatidylglycerophosphate/cardiolipin synthase-like enzyme